jgi:uncharacterized protein (TIGR04255 family)
MELVAEVRWMTANDNLLSEAQAHQGVILNGPVDIELQSKEDFFSRFAKEIDKFGFSHSERAYAAGSFVPPGKAVYRFRRGLNTPPIVQIGDGVLTINGLPPTYTTWDEFFPIVENALQAALNSRPSDEAKSPLTMLSLRYVNGFDERFLGGSTPQQFISEKLGFRTPLPTSLANARAKDQAFNMGLQFSLPLPDGGILNLQVGEGVAAAKELVLLDILFQFPDTHIDDVLSKFDSGHKIAHDVFEEVMDSSRDILEGQTNGS